MLSLSVNNLLQRNDDAASINNCFNALVTSLFRQLAVSQITQLLFKMGGRKWLGKEFLLLNPWTFYVNCRFNVSAGNELGVCSNVTVHTPWNSWARFMLSPYTKCFRRMGPPHYLSNQNINTGKAFNPCILYCQRFVYSQVISDWDVDTQCNGTRQYLEWMNPHFP